MGLLFVMRAAYLLAALCLSSTALAGDADKAYLEAKKTEKDVVVLPSGLMYKVLKKGGGAYHPTVDSPCSCHYSGTLIDGTQFDSSYDRGSPTTFAPNQVIKGWTEAMQMMVEGDKWEMYIPSDLGYGDRGSPPKIKGGDTLVFVMEIIKIKGDKVPALSCNPADLDTCNDKEKKFIEKVKSKDIKKEIARLNKMKSRKMKESLVAWINRRLHILEQM